MRDKDIEIMLLADNCLETIGGEQESTKIIIENLKNNFSIGVAQPGIIRNKEAGVEYYFLTRETRIKHLVKKPLSFMKYINNIKKLIKQEKPGIIHTQSQVSFFIIGLLLKLKLINKEFIFIHTERGLYSKYNYFFKSLFLYFMANLDVLITTTNYNKKLWEEALKNKKYKIKFKSIANTAGKYFEVYDEQLKKNSDTLTIGFSGRYTDWKDWPLAIEIINRLNTEIDQDFLVKMAIGCLDEKSTEKTKAMFNSIEKNIGDRFEGRINVSLEEMDAFYYDIDIFILTSKPDTESFGRTIIEAMSRKNIVLGTDAGGSTEVIGDSNYIFDDAQEAVNMIKYLYSDSKKMSKIKNNNFYRVKEEYSLQSNVDQHQQLYKKVLKGGIV